MLLSSLCLRLGYPHPDYLLPYLSASQLGDWVAFHQRHNLAFDRDDSYWTQHLAMYFNAHRPETESAREPSEFIPWYDPLDDELTVDDLKRKLGFLR